MIKYYNRKIKKYEVEKVAGEKYLNWTYTSPIGKNFLELLIKKKLFSKIYGWYCDRGISKNKIQNFIEDFKIDMSLCEIPSNKFKSFNDFFTRKLKKEARPINPNKSILISPGDGKLLAYDNIDLDKLVQVKGFTYSLYELIDNKSLAEEYKDGSCLILRLCPTDYHRFHFIDDGICEKTNKIKGFYYSVNPIALCNISKLFCQNKREYSIFHTTNFDDVIYLEVGATCVGSIIQSYIPNKEVKKGDEKGYFKFGGSTVILFFKKNTIKIHEDILNQTKLGYECNVILGEEIGFKI
ncbi:phosphatidylserine decarboxylase [Clostridium niameyense]|uniref:phosphatidylserine decarboxylase n=1 Tax=Clostridium niameyense TaxID=1622073 RepID=UPI00067EB77A|nr:phosphatidylserine decarboxylase [Clostridium niameyense]